MTQTAAAPEASHEAAPAGVTFSEMMLFVMHIAYDINRRQTDLVESGLRTEPHPDKVREQEICDAIIHLIDIIRADQVIMDRLRKKVELEQTSRKDSTRVAGPGAAAPAAGGR